MNRDDMNTIVDQDLTYMACGRSGSAQQALRMEYANLRRHYLLVAPETPRGQILRESIDRVEHKYRDDEFIYEQGYFEMDG